LLTMESFTLGWNILKKELWEMCCLSMGNQENRLGKKFIIFFILFLFFYFI
jgi:hypothetical protein